MIFVQNLYIYLYNISNYIHYSHLIHEIFVCIAKKVYATGRKDPSCRGVDLFIVVLQASSLQLNLQENLSFCWFNRNIKYTRFCIVLEPIWFDCRKRQRIIESLFQIISKMSIVFNYPDEYLMSNSAIR